MSPLLSFVSPVGSVVWAWWAGRSDGSPDAPWWAGYLAFALGVVAVVLVVLGSLFLAPRVVAAFAALTRATGQAVSDTSRGLGGAVGAIVDAVVPG